MVMGIPFIMNLGGMEPGRAEEDAKAEEVASRAQGQDAQIMQTMPGQPQGQMAGQMQEQMAGQMQEQLAPQQRHFSPFPGHTNRLSPTYESAGPQEQGQEQEQPMQQQQMQLPQQQMQMPQQAMQQMPPQQMQQMPQQAMQQQMPQQQMQQQMQYMPQPQYAPNPSFNAAYVQSLPPVGDIKSSSYGGGHAQQSSAHKFKVVVDR